MARICLLTAGQPSVNPRLVKEADALHEAGHEVHVLCSHYVQWADEADRVLLGGRCWSCTYVGGDRKLAPARYFWTRLRHGLTRRAPRTWSLSGTIRQWALSRVLPELQTAALRIPADLYISHYPGALVAAAAAARRNNALIAFDAEDFETGYCYATGPTAMDRLIESFERQYLPLCCYVTAASPGIAEAYSAKYAIPVPSSILNVFPLADRPQKFRPTKPDGPLQLYWFSQTIGLGRGLEDIIQAMGRVTGCSIELHLRGIWAPGHRKELYSLAALQGVGSQQIVVHEPAPPQEMIRLAAEFDVGLALEHPVSKSRELCLTNKIFSYLMAGNAVIGTATRGQRPIMEVIGEAGLCYEPGDVDALARCLWFWYRDRNALQQARQQSWQWGTQRFNWDLEKRKLVQLVNEVL